MNSMQGFIRYVDESDTQEDKFPAGLHFDSVGCGGTDTKGSLVTNGRHGQLQFYDPQLNKQRLSVSYFVFCFSHVQSGILCI